ncbi:hypothetical protein OHA72_19150 [Dactylosporangium sp. NBC_01737]|uniref:hypothetical protein n=1 Tax=Dactylosporangium sp. NBC_01737 TaxID=2975959 RepID=UPI002E10C539|nr:hypothetical protein OHA72_19150 [Dactylosporangium sp. NBC_01737]
MIVGSLLLIVVAVGLLVVGLLQGADALLVASIGASLLAAVALIVGGRQAAAARSSRAGRIGRQVPSDERYDPFESRLDGDGGVGARPASRSAPAPAPPAGPPTAAAAPRPAARPAWAAAPGRTPTCRRWTRPR